MSLPDGVTTCLLTYGPITDTFGNPADSITVEVVADRTIVHAASGRTMFKNPVTATATGSGSVQIPVPHTNQSGFRDQQQNALTGWYYTVNLRATFGTVVQTDVKTFQPVTGQTEVDADLLQSPGMVTPGSVTQTTYVADPGGGTDGQVLKKQGNGYVLGDGGGYAPPAGGIPKSDLSSAVQTSLGKADAAYAKPASGIPKADLASAVQASLDKADAATRQPALRNFSQSVPMTRSSLSMSAQNSLPVVSNGTDTAGMSVLRVDLSGAKAGAFRLVYMNSRSMLVSASNPITVKAGIDRQNGGQPIAVTFNGATSVTIPVDGIAVSDPVYINGPVLAGLFGVSATPPYVRPSTNNFAFVHVRTYVSVSSGQTWPLNHQCGLSGDGAESGTSVTDKTTNGATVTSAGAGTFTYGPAMVLNDAPSSLPIVLGVGDSIMNGSTDAAGQTGFFDRALRTVRDTMHNLRFAEGGTKPGNYFNNSGTVAGAKYRSLTALAGVTHCVFASGINFYFSAGSTVLTSAQNNTNKQTTWNEWVQLADMGIKVYACTLMPFTTSTDSWATTANQTPSVNEANRVDFNTWIRTVPSPLAGVIETADVVESARNSGLWKPNYTPDGLHPNSTGHAALAAVIPTGSFTA